MGDKYLDSYKIVSIENPLSDLPYQERIRIMRELGKKAATDFDNKLKEIHKWFSPEQDYDQVYLLAYCLRYFMMFEEGYDEEAAIGKLSFPPHYLEYLQALALVHPRNISARPLWTEGENLLKEMQELGNLMSLKLLDFPNSISTHDELNAYKIRVDMMSYHMAVRNRAYYFQMRKVSSDIAELIKSDFIAVHNADPVAFIDLIFKMSDQITKRINNHLKRLRSVLIIDDPLKLQSVYAQMFLGEEESKKRKKKMWKMAGKNMSNLRMMFIAHSDLQLVDIFTFSVEELTNLSHGRLTPAQIGYLFDRISYRFGDLKDIKQEHIMLGNPVLEKPFIKLGQSAYYSALWTTVPHLSISILESFVTSKESLRKKYNSQRSGYLENTLFALCQSCFPNGKVYRGSTWLADKVEHNRYENDVLVVVDSFALIFEAKSGILTQAAKRGAPDRLFKTLKDLIEAPSKQALRFIELLKKNRSVLSLHSKYGTHKIDLSNVTYFIPVGVTFYDLGVAGTNLKQMIDGRITSLKMEELALSLSLTDLQIVFEILNSEPVRIHYLHRRREIEASLRYFATELDLLAFYIDTGFNVGDYEANQEVAFQLTSKSKDLDPYFCARDTSKSVVTRPKLKRTKWWNEILQRVEHIKSARWIEFSYVLLNFNKSDQVQFEEGFTELKRKVRRNEIENEFNWVEFATASENRRYIVVGYAYRQTKHNTRYDDISYIMGHIMDTYLQVKGMVIIAVNVDNENYPYNLLAGELSVSLFDDLFQKMSVKELPPNIL